MITAQESLERLRAGNRRFVANESRHSIGDEVRRMQLVDGQEPFAVILGCADSRVPAEIVFDQGVGDLFVIRVAGNIVEPSQIGSVEFACAAIGTRLVVVLGHSRCGAIKATLDALRSPGAEPSANLRPIVDHIRPSIEAALAQHPEAGDDAIVEQAVRTNIRASTEKLRHASETIEALEQDDGLLIVGAEYSLETGVVEFFEQEPA